MKTKTKPATFKGAWRKTLSHEIELPGKTAQRKKADGGNIGPKKEKKKGREYTNAKRGEKKKSRPRRSVRGKNRDPHSKGKKKDATPRKAFCKETKKKLNELEDPRGEESERRQRRRSQKKGKTRASLSGSDFKHLEEKTATKAATMLGQ